jgi:riboflavin kinase / FMN adenylyltransferase
MEVLRGLESLPGTFDRTATTIGFFDGVHRGHQAVLGRTVEDAAERGLTPVAVTFDRHPREILTPGTAPKLLTTLERKAALIEPLGIKALLILEFTEDFSKWPPERFVDDVLVNGLHTANVVVGANFTFGHKALGNIFTLSDLGANRGFDVQPMGLLTIEGRRVSATSIREALSAGDLTWPEVALGRKHLVDGTVVTGAGRGAKLGFPTANMHINPRILLPSDGVYAGRATVEGRTHTAAINVGTNPTFGQEPLRLEAFLLDFQGDLLAREMTIEFWHRLRDELRFESADDLVEAIKKDVARTQELMR